MHTYTHRHTHTENCHFSLNKDSSLVLFIHKKNAIDRFNCQEDQSLG
uniref:Uncharacterized protein n=1 Tax=Anguilla anguilla TaxID=7936 RepID=A0A0E9XY77_ANGAN